MSEVYTVSAGYCITGVPRQRGFTCVVSHIREIPRQRGMPMEYYVIWVQ